MQILLLSDELSAGGKIHGFSQNCPYSVTFPTSGAGSFLRPNSSQYAVQLLTEKLRKKCLKCLFSLQ